ncbi:MAG TPA: hypothetical protein VGU02_08795 [Gaiellaceae bacterium]|nr:hypothetical protein [Gaiellaceae bacterium]
MGSSAVTPVPVTLLLNGIRVPAELGDDAIAALAAALSGTDPAASPTWLYGDKAAAAYLGWPLGRVQKLSAAGRLPFHRLGQRKTYNTADLDRALREGEP